MGGEHLVELLLVEGQHHPVAQRRDHGERGIAQALLMLLQIGLGDDHRILDRRAHPLAEPGIDPQVQEQGGEDRHDDRGRHGRDAEEQHHAGMQPGPRQASAALDPQGHQPAGEEDAQQQQDDQIDEKQDDRRAAPALGVAEASGQHAIGGEARGDGGDEQGHGQLALEADAPRPCHLAAHELPRPIH